VLPHGLFLALFTILGLAMGSFLNVCSDRLPGSRSIINPPSTCDSCNHRLGIRDLVPLFSYLWLRGRCRYCHAPIPRRLPAVELAMGLVFSLLYWRYGLSLELGFSLVYACLLALILVIDIEHKLILDKVVYPGMGLALVFSPFYPALGANAGLRVVSSISGGAAGLVIMLIVFILARGGMGMGDVKMAALVGLITGFPRVFIALFLSIMAGGLVAAALLALGLKRRRQPIPFGPFLAIGTMAVVVWGGEIQQWYQHLIV
jgi:leader peptidase (prepilin peptidase)/N-methyltransferase